MIKAINSDFAKDYYNHFLSKMGDYTKHRWHQNKQTEFDYRQTKTVILKIKSGLSVDRALEVGPGDGAWTEFLIEKIPTYAVLDQSIEMLKRLKAKFGDRLSYVQSDFLSHELDSKFDTAFAIRCFEYFSDKDLALQKFNDLLNPNATLIITTKNRDRFNKNSSRKRLHQDQVNMKEMKKLAKNNGFKLVNIYMTTVSLKSNWLISRFIFRIVFWLGLKLNSNIYNKLFNFATESHTYVLQKI